MRSVGILLSVVLSSSAQRFAIRSCRRSAWLMITTQAVFVTVKFNSIHKHRSVGRLLELKGFRLIQTFFIQLAGFIFPSETVEIAASQSLEENKSLSEK